MCPVASTTKRAKVEGPVAGLLGFGMMGLFLILVGLGAWCLRQRAIRDDYISLR